MSTEPEEWPKLDPLVYEDTNPKPWPIKVGWDGDPERPPEPVYDPEFCHCHAYADAVVLHDGHDERCIWSICAQPLNMDWEGKGD